MRPMLPDSGPDVADDLHPFHDAGGAVERIAAIYAGSVEALRAAFRNKRDLPPGEGVYPYLAIRVGDEKLILDDRFPYGVVLEPGFYGTTLTRPDLFRDYLFEQIGLLLHHYGEPVLVGRSRRRIPLPYVLEDSLADVSVEEVDRLGRRFALPDLADTDDRIANCQLRPSPSEPRPLSLFTAERVDYSLARLLHYTGTAPAQFQRFVLLTNYQRYVEGFRDYALEQLRTGDEYDG